MFLHGGPGSGSSPDHRRLFDPRRYNLIQFDQRGCGKSRPHGCLEDNTTEHLVSDISKLLDHLEVAQVHLAGGSWGSTLALSFGIKHTHRLRSLLLYGIFLCRDRELRALYFKDGVAHQIYPELFEQYLALLPATDQDNPIKGYNRLFNSKNADTRNAALLMWTRLEKQVSCLIIDEQTITTELSDPDFVLSHSLIENHYFLNNGFIDGEEVLRLASEKLENIPTHIITGRYDLVCPMITAYELQKALPHAGMTIVPDAGHSFREPGITDAIIRAADSLRRRAKTLTHTNRRW